jgi:hypothetical protein
MFRRMLRLAAVAVLSAVASPPAGAEEKPPPPVDMARVKAAIAKGAEFLKARVQEGLPSVSDLPEPAHEGQTYDELVLYTLLHADVPKDDPLVIKLVQDTRALPLAHTYGTAIRAQAFEKFDAVKMTADLVQCAQFLVDNQGQEGYWGYSKAVPQPALPKLTFSDAKPVASVAGSVSVSASPPVPADRATQVLKKRMTIARRGWGEAHDNSNTQYAMLGLTACMAAGIYPPEDTFALVEKWLTEQQNEDGGWCYQQRGGASYGSMTAGAVSTLGICLGHRKQDPLKDVRVQKGLAWLSRNLTFDGAPGDPWNNGGKRFQYYWIYSIERAGSLAGTQWFGDRPWYTEGAESLLAGQNADGSWSAADPGYKVANTCWAILFLKQASRHLRFTFSKS